MIALFGNSEVQSEDVLRAVLFSKSSLRIRKYDARTRRSCCQKPCHHTYNVEHK